MACCLNEAQIHKIKSNNKIVLTRITRNWQRRSLKASSWESSLTCRPSTSTPSTKTVTFPASWLEDLATGVDGLSKALLRLSRMVFSIFKECAECLECVDSLECSWAGLWWFICFHWKSKYHPTKFLTCLTFWICVIGMLAHMEWIFQPGDLLRKPISLPSTLQQTARPERIFLVLGKVMRIRFTTPLRTRTPRGHSVVVAGFFCFCSSKSEIRNTKQCHKRDELLFLQKQWKSFLQVQVASAVYCSYLRGVLSEYINMRPNKPTRVNGISNGLLYPANQAHQASPGELREDIQSLVAGAPLFPFFSCLIQKGIYSIHLWGLFTHSLDLACMSSFT